MNLLGLQLDPISDLGRTPTKEEHVYVYDLRLCARMALAVANSVRSVWRLGRQFNSQAFRPGSNILMLNRGC